MNEFEKYQSFLNEIKNIKFAEIPELTFLDIAGYPRYENVISNILLFLFNDKIHSFGNLWIKSLLECYKNISGLDMNLDIINVNYADREVSTKDNKRIDLVIETNKYLILIENKIDAPIYNPFSSYNDYAKEYIKDNNQDLKIIEVILSLNKYGNKIGNDYKFYNITYDMLIDKVKKNVGDYLLNSSDKWMIYMKDFMNTIENLKVGSNMNKEWNEFLEKNNDDLSDFFTKYHEDMDAKMKLLDDLTQKIQSFNKDYPSGSYNTKRYSKDSFYASNYVDIKYNNDTITIESYIMKRPAKETNGKANYLYIALWNRNNNNYNYSPILDKIKDIKGVNPEERKSSTNNWGKHYILKKVKLTDDYNIDELAELILKIADSIK